MTERQTAEIEVDLYTVGTRQQLTDLRAALNKLYRDPSVSDEAAALVENLSDQIEDALVVPEDDGPDYMAAFVDSLSPAARGRLDGDYIYDPTVGTCPRCGAEYVTLSADGTYCEVCYADECPCCGGLVDRTEDPAPSGLAVAHTTTCRDCGHVDTTVSV